MYFIFGKKKTERKENNGVKPPVAVHPPVAECHISKTRKENQKDGNLTFRTEFKGKVKSNVHNDNCIYKPGIFINQNCTTHMKRCRNRDIVILKKQMREITH